MRVDGGEQAARRLELVVAARPARPAGAPRWRRRAAGRRSAAPTCRRASASRPARMAASSPSRQATKARPRPAMASRGEDAGADQPDGAPGAPGERRSRSGPRTGSRASARRRAVRRQARADSCRIPCRAAPCRPRRHAPGAGRYSRAADGRAATEVPPAARQRDRRRQLAGGDRAGRSPNRWSRRWPASRSPARRVLLLLLVGPERPAPRPGRGSTAPPPRCRARHRAGRARRRGAIRAGRCARRDRVRRRDQGGHRHGHRRRRGPGPRDGCRAAARRRPDGRARVVADPLHGRLRPLRAALRPPRASPSPSSRAPSRWPTPRRWCRPIAASCRWRRRGGWRPSSSRVSALALAASIVAELVYRLAQLVLVMEDRRGRRRRPRRRRPSSGATRSSWRASCVAAVLLSTLAFVITLIAAAAFGLVSFVPVAGVAVLPLQAAVWVVRGLMLPFIELAALAAYAAVYRRAAGPPADRSGSSGASPCERRRRRCRRRCRSRRRGRRRRRRPFDRRRRRRFHPSPAAAPAPAPRSPARP